MKMRGNAAAGNFDPDVHGGVRPHKSPHGRTGGCKPKGSKSMPAMASCYRCINGVWINANT